MSGRRESVNEVVVSNQFENKSQTNELKNTKVSESPNNDYKNDELSSKIANETSEKDQSIKESSSYLPHSSVESNLESNDKFDERTDPSILCKDFDNKIDFNENDIKESEKLSEQRKSSTFGVDQSLETNVFTDLTKNTNKRSSVSDLQKSNEETVFSDLTKSSDNSETISSKSDEEKRSSICGNDKSSDKYVIIEQRKSISVNIDNLDNNSENISGTTSAQQIDVNKTQSDVKEDSTQNLRKISLSNDSKNIIEEIKEKEKMEENKSESDLRDKTDIILVSKSDSNDNINKNKSSEKDITLSSDHSKQTTIDLIDEKGSKIKVVTKDSKESKIDDSNECSSVQDLGLKKEPNDPNSTDNQLTGRTHTSEDSNKTITSLESSKVESISKESKDLSQIVLSKDTNLELSRFEERETKSIPSNQLQPTIEDKSKSLKENVILESEASKSDDIKELTRSSQLKESSISDDNKSIHQKPIFFETKKSISGISDDFDEISPNSSDINRSDLFKEVNESELKMGEQKPEVSDKLKDKIEVNMDLKSEIELVEKMNVSSDESDRKNSFLPQIDSQIQSFAKDSKRDSFGTDSKNISQTNVPINKPNTDLDQNFKQFESDISSKEMKESIDKSKICDHKQNQTKPDLNNKEIKSSSIDDTIGNLSSMASKTCHQIEESNKSKTKDSINLKTEVFPIDDKLESQTHRKSVDITKTDDKNFDDIINKEKTVEEININLNSKTESLSKPTIDSTICGQTVEIEFTQKLGESKDIIKEKPNEINLSADHSKQSEIEKQSEESVKSIQSLDKQKVEDKLVEESNVKDSNIEDIREKGIN